MKPFTRYLIRKHVPWMGIAVLGFALTGSAQTYMGNQNAIVKQEFIFESAPFKSCHASTVLQTRQGLMAAWFGGAEEGALDVGIWLSTNSGKGWSEPVEVANGLQEADQIRYPCWNPVLFQPRNGPVHLFYKVGPNPVKWWGMVTTSRDHGKTWSTPRRLPKNIIGPVKNKPIQLDDGTVLCGSSTEDAGWRVHLEFTDNQAQMWRRIEALNSAMVFGAIQPTLLNYPDKGIQILCRTKQDAITECWSQDNGQTWSLMRKTQLPNPNSGLDAVMLHDGRALLVYNHTTSGRGMLNVAMTNDGKKWFAGLVLENNPGQEFSYPAVIQTGDGLVHITYTWNRERIKHVVLDPEKLELREMPEGFWP